MSIKTKPTLQEPFAPQLYIRDINFVNEVGEKMIGQGPNQAQEWNVFFQHPGWIAVDLAADVAHTNDGEIPTGILTVHIDDMLVGQMRGSYTWTRYYFYVDAGPHVVVFRTDENYKPKDRAWLRRRNATLFKPVDSIDLITKATPPVTLQETKRFKIINGYDRYQQTGPGGTEIDMEIMFSANNKYSKENNYRTFMREYQNFYILKYRYGLYGGMLVDPTAKHLGPLTILKTKFVSSERAGIMLSKNVNSWGGEEQGGGGKE